MVFRGGVRRRYNRIIVRTRAGDNRSREAYIEHCRAIVGGGRLGRSEDGLGYGGFDGGG